MAKKKLASKADKALEAVTIINDDASVTEQVSVVYQNRYAGHITAEVVELHPSITAANRTITRAVKEAGVDGVNVAVKAPKELQLIGKFAVLSFADGREQHIFTRTTLTPGR